MLASVNVMINGFIGISVFPMCMSMFWYFLNAGLSCVMSVSPYPVGLFASMFLPSMNTIAGRIMLYIVAKCHHCMFSEKLTTSGKITNQRIGRITPNICSVVIGDFRFCT